MSLNYNDELEKTLIINKYYPTGMNPFYGKFIKFLNDSGIYKIEKSISSDLQMLYLEKYLKSNPDIFNKLLRFAIDYGFLEEINIRYSFSNRRYRKKEDYNQFSVLKYKIIGGHLYVYDVMNSIENQKLLEVSSINGYNAKDIIEKFYSFGYTDDQIQILIQHKEILTSIGFESDNFEISLPSEKLVLDLSNPSFRINPDIFYKEHRKSNLLGKENFDSLVIEEKTKEDISSSFDCNIKLLKILHGLSKSSNDLLIFENILKKANEVVGYKECSDTNVDWMYISSFFLMNKEEKHDLPDYIYPEFYRKLKLASNGGPWLIFLDEKNNEQSYGYNVDDSSFESNSYIFNNGRYDTKKIFHAVRDALAHSSYEIIDDDYIRIYYYDEQTKNITANFKIKKDIVLEFMDKISEFRSFGNLFPVCTLEHPNIDNKKISDLIELKSYLRDIVVSDVVIKSYSDLDKLKQLQQYARLIEHLSNSNPTINIDDDKISSSLEYDYLEKIRQMKFNMSNPMCRYTREIRATARKDLRIFADYEYNEKKLTEEQIDKILHKIESIKDTFFEQGAYNQHEIITELVRNELDPSRNITSIISDIVKTKDKSSGSLMDMLNETSVKYVDYDKVLKATIIAYLNNTLLYSFNGNTIDCSGLDFTCMTKNLQPLINTKQNDISNKKSERGNKRKTIVKNEKRIKIIDRIIASKSNDVSELIDEKRKKEEENIRLKEEIDNLDRIIQTLEQEIESIRINSSVDNYYVLEHLRNSLAHGNISFNDSIDINNISDLEITFTDYYPKKSESDIPVESFKGTIKLGDLLNLLNDEKYMLSLFVKNNDTILN